jgi:excisionase family DNA binding protein
MVAAQEMTVREAARRVGRSEETVRRWIWSGRLPAVKRGAGYRIDVMHLDRVMVELEAGVPGRGTTPNTSMLDWLEEVDQWKREVATNRGPSASELVIEDRRAHR